MDGAAVDTSQHRPFAWSDLRQLLGNRMLLGVYIAQHRITAITYFFLTWFPLYLIKDRGMSILNAGLVASLAGAMRLFGGVLGGVISRRALPPHPVADMGPQDSDHRRHAAVDDHHRLQLRHLAHAGGGGDGDRVFRQGRRARSAGRWSRTPRRRRSASLSGGLFNMFGNTAGITTPIIIGYMIQHTGSFNGALVFIGFNAFVAMAAYLFVVVRDPPGRTEAGAIFRARPHDAV